MMDNDLHTSPLSFASSFCYYQTLHLPLFSSIEQVKIAFRKCAKQSHPDETMDSTSSQLFTKVHEAYLVLSNPQLKLKLKYDAWLQASQTLMPPHYQISLRDVSLLNTNDFTYNCRCGHSIDTLRTDLNQGYSIFECEGCSIQIELV